MLIPNQMSDANIKHTLLVVRLSALGDVALVRPVLQSLLTDEPDIQIVMVSKPHHEALFNFSPRILFFPADTVRQFHGLLGIWRLASSIRKKYPNIYQVIDLHDTIRSRGLSTFFRAVGIPVFRIDKYRRLRKAVLRDKAPSSLTIPHVTTLYQQVFERAGWQIQSPFTPIAVTFNKSSRVLWGEKDVFKKLKNAAIWIGVSPFAGHASKCYPIHDFLASLRMLKEAFPGIGFIFMGSPAERSLMQYFTDQINLSVNLAGVFSLQDELSIISALDAMIAMDSGNMHLAATCGTPVISIWLSTHPNVGFRPLFYEGYMIQSPHPSRPISIFGKLSSDKDQQLSTEIQHALSPIYLGEEMIRCLGQILTGR
jgi:ADP-heptose:LPS heptosyltransferase